MCLELTQAATESFALLDVAQPQGAGRDKGARHVPSCDASLPESSKLWHSGVYGRYGGRGSGSSSGATKVRRISVLVVGALILSAPMLSALPPAVASQNAPTDWGAIQGTYNLFYDYGPTGTYTEGTLTLYLGHTGTDQNREMVKWLASGRKITLRFSDPSRPVRVTASFRGRITQTGFSSRKRPGTMSNSGGETGVWYAVKTS